MNAMTIATALRSMRADAFDSRSITIHQALLPQLTTVFVRDQHPKFT